MEPPMGLLKRLSRIAVTVAATAAGVVDVGTGRHESSFELKTGEPRARFLARGIGWSNLSFKGSGWPACGVGGFRRRSPTPRSGFALLNRTGVERCTLDLEPGHKPAAPGWSA